MHESQRQQRLSEVEDWLEGPFVKDLQRWLDAEIAHVEATPLLEVNPANLPQERERALGTLEALMGFREVTQPGTATFNDCFFPEEVAE